MGGRLGEIIPAAGVFFLDNVSRNHEILYECRMVRASRMKAFPR